jgi:Mrp family chromosome partitioning ATPase
MHLNRTEQLPFYDPDQAPSWPARAIRAHWLLVAVVGLVALVAGVVAVSVRDPEYEATARLLVSPLPQDQEAFFGTSMIRDSGDPAKTADTAARLVKTDEAAGLAAKLVERGFTREGVASAVSVEPEGESNVLAVKATAKRPDGAARVANSYVRAVLRLRQRALAPELDNRIADLRAELSRVSADDIEAQRQLRGQLGDLNNVRDARSDPTISLAAEATPPGSPSHLASAAIVGMALIGGLLLGGLAALGAERLGRSLERTEEALLSAYPLPVLARVPAVPRRLRRRGPISQVALAPRVRETYRTVSAQLEDRQGSHRAILATSASRGDGRTTTAAGLGVGFADAGYSVVLLDLDFANPSLSRAVGAGAAEGLGPLLTSGGEMEDYLLELGVSANLRVLPAVGAWPAVEGDIRRLVGVLGQARGLADYIVIDAPPLAAAGYALRIAREVEELVVVARPGHTSRRELQDLRDLIERMEAPPAGLVLAAQGGGSLPGLDAYVPSADGSGRSAPVPFLRR